MYTNMDVAVDMFKYANNNIQIGIVADSDGDGNLSAAIAYLLCKEFGKKEPIVLFHSGKQHGIQDLMQDIIDAHIDFLILPDSSSNENDACLELEQHRCTCLVLDHHIMEQENEHAVVVNP